jgi:hypothetical protein
MKHLASTSEFFEYGSIFETINLTADEIWQKLNNLVLPDPKEVSIQEQLAIDSHQFFMLENFDSIEEINNRENFLHRHGYSPVMLTLEGAYFETIDSIELLSEGVLDSIQSFLSLMTEGGSAIGILQFVLDVLGVIPFDWAGIPVNEVSNIINAMISFYRGNYVLGLISLGMAIPAVGGILFAPIKILVRPFTGIANKLFGAMFKADSVAVKAAAQELKAANGSSELVSKLGQALPALGRFCADVASKIISKLSNFIAAAIEKVSFGKLKIPASALKWVDDIVLKLKNLSTTAGEASEVLLKQEGKVAASAAELSAAGEKAAAQAAKQGKTGVALADEVAKKFDKVPQFSKALQAEVMASSGFKKLANASPAAQEAYIKSEISRKLIDQILKESGKSRTKSLIQILQSPEMVKTLSKSKKFRGLDKALLDAVAAGDKAAIKNVMDLVASNPAIMKMVSPRVAKTMAIFKEAPEFLFKGRKVVDSAVDAAGKLPKVKMPWGLSTHTRTSSKRLIGFILKSLIKGNDCLKYLSDGDSSEIYDKASKLASEESVAGLTGSIKETLEQLSMIFEEEDFGITPAEIEELKTSSPEAYQALKDQFEEAGKSIDDLVSATDPKNPCVSNSAVAMASTGGFLARGLQSGLYKERGKGDVYNIFDEEAAAGLTDMTKAALRTVGEDPNIDAQSSLASADPYIKAYFSDSYDFDEEIYKPVQSGESRLDSTLDNMVKSGEIPASEKEKIKTETLKHWENDTAPDALNKKLEIVKESSTVFKVGHVKIR